MAMLRHVLAHNGGQEQAIVGHLATLIRPGGSVYLADGDQSGFRILGRPRCHARRRHPGRGCAASLGDRLGPARFRTSQAHRLRAALHRHRPTVGVNGDPLFRWSVRAAGRPARTQVSRGTGLSRSDREFPALTGRSGTQRHVVCGRVPHPAAQCPARAPKPCHDAHPDHGVSGQRAGRLASPAFPAGRAAGSTGGPG